MSAPVSSSVERESARLEALDHFDILDTPSEEAFDRITRLAKKIFKVPIAIVSFIDAHRQWYKSCPGAATKQVPREHTFCKHVIADGKPLIVSDATKDSRFLNNPYVLADRGVRFYAGLPLQTRDGHNVGSLCLVDMEPRSFAEENIEIMAELAALVMSELELRLAVDQDNLTDVFSRRAFKEAARRATALALRHHQNLSILSCDLDHFKRINDTFGHGAGDHVLKSVARTCTMHLRESDTVGRMGGEEFLVLLPNTAQNEAENVAEKLRAAIEASNISWDEQLIKVTASFGVASLGPSARDIDTLLEQADRALYVAKEGGRNRVSVWHAQGEALVQRRRVLKAGQILFNGRSSSMDCTVRALSNEGAELSVNAPAEVPKLFYLTIESDSFEKACRVIAQRERQIEVAFC